MSGCVGCLCALEQLRLQCRGGEKQRKKCYLWLVPLHYIPIVIYFLTWCHTNRPMTTKSTYYYNHYINYTTLLFLCRPTPSSPWLRLPPRTPPSPPVPCRSCCDLLLMSWGLKTAERQPDKGSECEGRRGGSPDLPDWGRPAREMYSLPLLYRNLSPYEYKQNN